MKNSFLEDSITEKPWLPPVQKALDQLSDATIQKGGRGLRNFLHGTWLGHPFHPAIVSLPIGAFATAAVLDLVRWITKEPARARSAQTAVGFGLVTATLSASAGLADWSKTDQPARRVGVLHALFNGSATVLYLGSWLLRRRGRDDSGAGLGLAGLGLLLGGAYLGGSLVYRHQVGVDHAQREGPDGFISVCPEAELPENEPHRVEINGVGILLVKQGGRIFAIGERCAHMGGPLAEGTLEGSTIQCPWHGSRFDLRTGEVVNGPSAFPQPCFAVRVEDGQIKVRYQMAGMAAKLG